MNLINNYFKYKQNIKSSIFTNKSRLQSGNRKRFLADATNDNIL
jgi:hypothetical protein